MLVINRRSLNAAIVKNGTTLEGLANDIGVDRTTLFRRLRNNTLRVCDIYKIVEVLHLTPQDALDIFLAEECQS